MIEFLYFLVEWLQFDLHMLVLIFILRTDLLVFGLKLLQSILQLLNPSHVPFFFSLFPL